MLRDTTSRGLYVRVWPPHLTLVSGAGEGEVAKPLSATGVVRGEFYFLSDQLFFGKKQKKDPRTVSSWAFKVSL